MRPIRTSWQFAACFMFTIVASVASAQGKPPGTVTTSASGTGLYQFDATTDSHGKANSGSATISGSITRQVVTALTLGASASYSAERWTIADPAAFSQGTPWRDLRRVSIGVPMTLALSRSLLVGCTASAEWAGEQGVIQADAAIYGTVLSVAKVFNPRLTMGGGASLSHQFYSNKVSPFLIVNWRLSERLRIANAFSAGPEGGAGIELRCTLTPEWELAAGGVLRSDRYRLADSGAYPRAIGEKGGIPVFARASRKLGERLRADVYAGVLAQGRIRIKDDDGNELATTRYPAQPALAVTLAFRR